MKFTRGQWVTKKNHDFLYPLEVADYSFDGKDLMIYAATRPTPGRAQTVDQPLLTVRIHAPWPDIAGVEIIHFAGELQKPPVYPVEADPDWRPMFLDKEDSLSFVSGGLEVRIGKKPYSLAYFYQGRLLASSPGRAEAYIVNDQEQPFMREQLTLGVGECVYGLGERFTPFVKNGQVVEMWNEDGGTSTEIAYKNIPFYLTSGGYGVFVCSPGDISFEVASENVERVQFSTAGERLAYYIVGGEDLKQTLSHYTAFTGRPALPPPWSFGLWLSTSFTTNYDERTVSGFLDGMAQRDIPLDVFHFDCFWMKEFHWCDFTWDDRVFPDPAGMLARIKGRGLRICVWINPYIAQKSPLFQEGMEKGYFLKRPNGDVWQWDKWQAGMALVDFTNPEAAEWYQGCLRNLLQMGVDCFKTDFGERIPTDVVYYNGADPVKMHNFYSYLYNQAVFSLLEKERGTGEAVVFARSATACSNKFPVHWGGDCWATYESMAESLRGGLSLSLCGFGFWSHDIGGFENTATPDIYKRWAAFGLLSSHSRLHGSSSYRVPWAFDEEAVEVLRFFTKLKCRLMPYLYGCAVQARDQGLPVMRPMVLEFPKDPLCKHLDLQYMLGDSLLVAPVFREDGMASYYLPEGNWTDLLHNRVLKGGMKTEYHDYCSIPLLAAPDSLIPMGIREDTADYDNRENVVLHLCGLEDGAAAQARVWDKAGSTCDLASAQRSGRQITVTYTKEKSSPCTGWTLILHGFERAVSVENGECHEVDAGLEIRPKDLGLPVRVNV